MRYNRDKLKHLLTARDEINSVLQSEMTEYINSLGESERGNYVSDHAIIRYVSRVINDKRVDYMDDLEAIEYIKNRYSVSNIRDLTLPIDIDRIALKSLRQRVTYDGITYIFKNLTLVTIYKN